MKKCSVFLGLFILLFPALFFPGGIKDIEVSLSGTAAKQRIQALGELVNTYREKVPQKALEYGREALKLLRIFPDPKREMVFLNHMSTASIWLGDYSVSQYYARQSRAIALRLHDKTGEADALYNIAQGFYMQGNYKEAKNRNSQSYSLYHQLGYQPGLAESHRLMSNISWKIGDFAKALEYASNALEIYETLRDRRGVAEVKNIYGIVSAASGEYKEGLDYFSEALRQYEAVGEKSGVARTLNNIGFTYCSMANPAKSLQYFKRSLEISRELGAKGLTSTVFTSIGEAYAQMNDSVQALEYFAKSLHINREINDTMGIAYNLIQIGKTKGRLGQYRQARESLEQALEIARRINIKNEIKSASRELSDIFAVLGQYRNALAYYKEYKEIDEILFNERSQKKMVDLQALYETDKKEKEVALLKKERQLQQLEWEQQENFKNYFILIAFLAFLLAFLLYTGYRLKTRVSDELSKEIQGHRQTAAKLRESEEKFRTLAEKSAVGICIIQDQAIKYVNPAFLSVFGYSLEEMTGQSPLKLVTEEDRALVEQKFERLMSGDPSHHPPGLDSSSSEFKGLDKAGTVLYLESHSVYSFYQGQPAILESVVDITDRKKAEIELLKMRKLEFVGTLAGGISHDFNHLLTVITRNTQKLKQDVEHIPSLDKMVEKLEETALKGTHLAQKLITFSGGGSAVPRKVILSSILNSIILTYPQMQKLVRTTSIPIDLKPLYGDEGELGQVIGNLLWNAQEAKTDNREAEVTIAAENTTLPTGNNKSLKAGDYIKVTIADNGKGIPSDQLEWVFDPYFSTKETFYQKGMGLGLAICYAIIKRHNGHISIKSEMGKGTTVELLLPVYGWEGE